MPNGSAPPPMQRSTTQEQLSETLDLSSLLGTAVDTVQTQLTRVLKVRNEQTIRLPKHLFLRYFTLNRLFADECEAVSGRSGQGLKGIINAQITGFVQVLGAVVEPLHDAEKMSDVSREPRSQTSASSYAVATAMMTMPTPCRTTSRPICSIVLRDVALVY